ncbi:MAG: hypothetical protein L0214_08200 [candidate division NC10 bacterium]|nr:hypothetical protein [candidate division NC10 bacterium]
MGTEAGAGAEIQATLVAARDALRAVLAEVDGYLATLRPVLGREIRQIFDRELTTAEDAVRALEGALEALGGEAGDSAGQR